MTFFRVDRQYPHCWQGLNISSHVPPGPTASWVCAMSKLSRNLRFFRCPKNYFQCSKLRLWAFQNRFRATPYHPELLSTDIQRSKRCSLLTRKQHVFVVDHEMFCNGHCRLLWNQQTKMWCGLLRRITKVKHHAIPRNDSFGYNEVQNPIFSIDA